MTPPNKKQNKIKKHQCLPLFSHGLSPAIIVWLWTLGVYSGHITSQTPNVCVALPLHIQLKGLLSLFGFVPVLVFFHTLALFKMCSHPSSPQPQGQPKVTFRAYHDSLSLPPLSFSPPPHTHTGHACPVPSPTHSLLSISDKK